MSPESEMSIRELLMDCTFPLPEGNESDATFHCGKTAQTAVVPPQGGLQYRCQLHKGLVNGGVTGAVQTTVPFPRIPGL